MFGLRSTSAIRPEQWEALRSAHPNGRTARVILDWMLMRAGFPALPHSMETRDPYFRDLPELEELLYRAYQRDVRP